MFGELFNSEVCAPGQEDKVEQGEYEGQDAGLAHCSAPPLFNPPLLFIPRPLSSQTKCSSAWPASSSPPGPWSLVSLSQVLVSLQQCMACLLLTTRALVSLSQALESLQQYMACLLLTTRALVSLSQALVSL